MWNLLTRIMCTLALLIGGAIVVQPAWASSETLFTTQTPQITDGSDGVGVNYELGTAFTSNLNGQITAIRFWKAPSETGVHTGHIWSSSGQLLASVTFSTETASGWQQQALTTPLVIAASTAYVVSVNTGDAFYTATIGGLASQVTNQDLRSVVGQNGIYGSPGQFPTNTFDSTNYFRDIVFTPTSGGTSTLFTTQTPQITNGSDGVGVNYELGTAFVSDIDGQITAVRFWKASSETGVHTGHIWSSSGQLLTSVIFSAETASGWQQQALTIPLLVTANTTYVVSVNTGNAFYTATIGGLSSQIINQDLLSVVGQNGLYGSPGLFPTNTFQSTSYFRDIVFTANSNNASSLASVTMNPTSVTGGSSSTGTVTLNSAAPNGGEAVALSVTNPLVQPHTIQSINNFGALQADGSITWSSVAAPFTNVPSTTVVPVSGITGLNATLTNNANQPLQSLSECPSVTCGWGGNFDPGADILWDGGIFLPDGVTWVGNGPMTVSFSSPQRGVGFQIMADEGGPFTATLCALDSSHTSLGCAPFSGNASDPQAMFIGIYDDTQEISSITVDAGGAMFPHDFAIGDLFVVNGQKQLATVPASVTVPAGTTTTTFQVTTNPVSSSTSVTITGNDVTTQTATLTLTPPDLTSIATSPQGVTGGTSSTGTVTLANPAPVGGAVVTLVTDVPAIQPHTIQTVTNLGALQAEGSIAWSILGTPFTNVPSGTVVPVSGVAGLNVTLANSASKPLQYLTECPATNCGWGGTFGAGGDVLWVGNPSVGNGPMSISFSSPQRGIGFQVNPDESGAFTATICALDSSSTLLGCKTFNESGSQLIFAPFVGIYDDTQEISKVTIDGGGVQSPHDFAIGDPSVVSGARPVEATVPASVTVPSGQTSATFTVTTNAVIETTYVTITGSYSGTQSSNTIQITH